MLIQDIKTRGIQAKKNGDKKLSLLLMTLYSDASMIGKNDGNRESTDEEVIKTIKKFIKGLNEIIDRPCDVEFKENALWEKKILEEYLPTQISREKIILLVNDFFDQLIIDNSVSMKEFGSYMKKFKEMYPYDVDMSLVSNLLKEKIKCWNS